MSNNQEIHETLQQLKDADEKVRSQAALSLGWIGEIGVIEPLIEALEKDPSAKVRANAAMSLGQLNDQNAISPLIAALTDTDAFVRGMVIYSLGLMKAKKARKYLVNVLETDPDKEARMAAADSLAQIGDESTLPHLVKAYVHDHEKAVKTEAKNSLKRLGASLNYPDIEKLIQEESKKLEVNLPPVPPAVEIKMDEHSSFDELNSKAIDNRQSVKITYIIEELPKLLEYAIHKEVIPFQKICHRFNCDDSTLEMALTKLIENKSIDAQVNGKKKTFTITKHGSNLSEDAQLKLKLIRKKFGIDW